MPGLAPECTGPTRRRAFHMGLAMLKTKHLFYFSSPPRCIGVGYTHFSHSH